MQEHVKQQHIPVKIYRTDERLMIATPMAGLEPENILVDEWSVGVYHRELALPVPVNAVCANVTYGNGVLMVALPISTPDIPRTINARTGHPYPRGTQRQRGPPCDLHSNVIA